MGHLSSSHILFYPIEIETSSCFLQLVQVNHAAGSVELREGGRGGSLEKDHWGEKEKKKKEIRESSSEIIK